MTVLWERIGTVVEGGGRGGWVWGGGEYFDQRVFFSVGQSQNIKLNLELIVALQKRKNI